MSEHRVHLSWSRSTPEFTYDTYARGHAVRFEGGAEVLWSAAAGFHGDARLPNPEEALVAALSSCHLLSFLAIAARKRLTVDAYSDAPVGHLGEDAEGKLAVIRVELRPRVTFAPAMAVDAALLAKLHHQAHAECFIARSVRTEVVVEPR